MKKTEKISFRLTEDLKLKVEQFAKLQGINVSFLVRNWISLFIENIELNNNSHYYELANGKQFPDMKALCEELNISSRTARNRVKKGLIRKLTHNPYQTQKYGGEISVTNSSRTR